ncbi:MAG: SDR family NAD(P)-dependent oxidoreductase [Clostridia bacterium]|nr:SDR family NAD(P)-dependent oxidoreductase [Clostridia bacterium]
MKNVCVITGGGSGMGLAAAKFMPKDKIIVLSGRTVAKLEKAVNELKELGYEAYPFACDTSKRESVKALAQYCASLGEIKNVINCAGLSPAMADQEKILRVNALGTVYVNQEFSALMKPGSVIVDVSSNSAYILPSFIIPKKAYALAETDEEGFVKKLIKRSNMAKGDYQRSGFAYSLSKNFVVWYAKKCAFEYGHKGIRVVSLSPGLIATDMGNLEAKDGGMLIPMSCEERMGKPEELGFAIATVADERNGYLAGVDVLCDGGSTNGMKEFKKKKK